MTKEIIYTPNAPEPIGPYSQAVLHNGLLYVSGQIALNSSTNELENKTIESETRQVMKNLEAILTAAGSSFEKVIKCSIFLCDMNTFSKVNAIYGEAFTTNPPARETVEVSALPKGVQVEISCIAYV